MLILILINLITTSLISADDYVQVDAPSGNYVGLKQNTYDGIPYTVFKGIEYGKIAKRFQEAVVVPDSNETKNATEFGPVCYQLSLPGVPKFTNMNEDCLYMNLYTPDVNGSLPVLVFMHGGSYETGSPNNYSGEYFMRTKKAIAITIAYRLNLFGYLYMDDPKYPANLGIRDQIVALKWIQKNVKHFGGDPSKVTLGGQSAGATSANILMLSKLSKGLIAGVISESGPACSVAAMQPRCFGMERRNAFAKVVGCNESLPAPGGSADDFVNCLRKKTPEELLNSMIKMNVQYSFLAYFLPIVEPSSVPDAVLTESPSVIPPNSVDTVPWLVGANSNEGRGIVPFYPPLTTTFRDYGTKLFKGDTLPNIMMYKYQAVSPKYVTKSLRHHYGSLFRRDYTVFMYQLVNNNLFLYSTYRCLRASSVAYTYYFNYTTPQHRGEGAGHGDELPFLWDPSFKVQQSGDPTQVELSLNLVNAWVHFATYQNASFANTAWEQYDLAKDNWLIINPDEVKMGLNPNKKNNTYWETLNIDTSPKSRHCSRYQDSDRDSCRDSGRDSDRDSDES